LEDEGDRKYDPTPRRREKFRQDGRIPKARDAAPVAGALLAVGAILGTETAARTAVAALFRTTVGDVGALARGEWAMTRQTAAAALATLAIPPLVAACVGAIALGAAQSGLSLNFEHAGFKWERLDPLGKLQQMFSFKTAGVELLLAVLKVSVVFTVAYFAILEESPALLGLARVTFPESAKVLLEALLAVALKTLLAGGGIALVDYLQSRYRIEQDMKMTLQELKDDMRSEDGDPRVKARMRARARQAARKRMMSDVKQAAVIVTNPTHVSVALRYGNSDPAPIVVAKGHDEVALAIRREARKHGVPILENRPLARVLDAQVPIGKPVKIEHFAAVARVLAFVYQMRRRQRPAPSRQTPDVP
jgi:flagellar biosynthesis protein FlhB